MCGPRNRSGRIRKIAPLLDFETLAVHPVTSRYTDYAIPEIYTCIRLFLRAFLYAEYSPVTLRGSSVAL